ncbi:hypothetical protein [Glaciecola sp. KUL10]|uniref:hypothetical protein n=1 Tax=Glaciecola sp. (strain KUL10) TaxID=2161813 RepID=UPI000D782EE8|nr:hypothetical protein [Glaciecola sp. KUL10]
MQKKLLLASTILFLSLTPSLSSASLINQSDGELNWSLDVESKLQWLDLTHTTGLSYNQMKQQFGDWTVATESQWREMYSRNFDGDWNDGTVFGENSAYQYDASLGIEVIEKNGTDAFQIYSTYSDFFGHSRFSFERMGGPFDINHYKESFFSLALYVNDIDAGFDITARLRIGGISAIIDRDRDAYSTTVENYVNSTANFGRYWQMLSPNENPEHGWYLIKEAPESMDLSTPATITIFILTLVLLIGQRNLKSIDGLHLFDRNCRK